MSELKEEERNDLTTIQAILKAPKNQYNSFGKYKYRNAEDIQEALKPLLYEYNCQCVVSDKAIEVDGMIIIESVAVFTDSTGVETLVTAQAGVNPTQKGMALAQCFGSSSSYSRKYALGGLFLLDDTKDADSQPPPKAEPKKRAKGVWNTDVKDRALSKNVSLERAQANYEMTQRQCEDYLYHLRRLKG